MDTTVPKCQYWNRDKPSQWLKENVVSDGDDKEWLITEESNVYSVMDKAAEEKQEGHSGCDNILSSPTESPNPMGQANLTF
jgi:hypothetical protein